MKQHSVTKNYNDFNYSIYGFLTVSEHVCFFVVSPSFKTVEMEKMEKTGRNDPRGNYYYYFNYDTKTWNKFCKWSIVDLSWTSFRENRNC